MPDTSVKFTYQDLLTAPEDRNRYEIFEGELTVTPSPNIKHQNAVFNLALILGQFVKKKALGKMFTAPMDVYFDEETVVEPDLLFISKDRLHVLEEQRIYGAPDLIIEILSPATAERDRGFKFRRYEQEEVKEYWLVDPMEEKLQIYVLGEKGFNLKGKFTNNEPVSGQIFADLSFTLKQVWE